MDRAILNIRKRLERWELSHLQALSAAQAEEIDTLRAEVERLKREVEHAEDTAYNAYRMLDLEREVARDQSLSIGLTIHGELIALPKEAQS